MKLKQANQTHMTRSARRFLSNWYHETAEKATNTEYT